MLAVAGNGWGATITLDSVKGTVSADTMKGETIKTMKQLPETLKVADKISISGAVQWAESTGVDEFGYKIYPETRGIISYHLLPEGKWRTVIEIDGRRYEGESVMDKGAMVTTITKKTVMEIEPVIKPVVGVKEVSK